MPGSKIQLVYISYNIIFRRDFCENSIFIVTAYTISNRLLAIVLTMVPSCLSWIRVTPVMLNLSSSTLKWSNLAKELMQALMTQGLESTLPIELS